MTTTAPFRVLVTRPQPQGEVLCQHLQAAGYDTVFLPVIEIRPLSDSTQFREQLKQLACYNWAIFISRSAVVTSETFIHQQWPQLPPALQVAAVGEGTAAALKEARLPVHVYPKEQASSEALLALPEFQNLAGKKLAIFCGEGGREYLAAILRERGAQVTRFVSYQRVLPKLDLQPVLDLLHCQQIDALVCTSVEAVTNLRKLFAEAEWRRLKKIPLVLISERIMIQAKALGFEICFLATAASHQGILQALNRIRKEAMNPQERKSPESKLPEANADATPGAKSLGESHCGKKVFKGKATLFFLALLTLILCGLAGMIYYRTSTLNQTVAAFLAHSSNQNRWNEREIFDLQNELSQLRQGLRQQEEVLRRQTQALQNLHGLVQNGPSNRGRDRGAILDAQYFVKLANDQLLLANDLPQALNFLTQAQAELKSVADPRALPLKKALEQDLALLKNTPGANLTVLYLNLISLQRQVSSLPLLLVPVQQSEKPAFPAKEAQPSAWEKGWRQVWSTLRQMIIVYHLPTTNTPPFITPDQRPYLYENLRAVLSAAGWAVLHRNPEIYQASLQQAVDWVRQYFSLNAPQTKTLLGELHALQALTINPAKEWALGSPKVFQDYLKTEPAASTAMASP